MSRVLILVEGQTERAIVQNVFAPILSIKGIYLYPKVVGKPGHKGGGKKFSSILHELTALLRQEPGSIVSTIFDYYALPNDWPGVSEACKSNEPHQIIESATLDAVKQTMGDSFNAKRFIPYIQMHEIEALLFAGPEKMAQVFEDPLLAQKFESIVEQCDGCEKINKNPATAPSKRIKDIFPGYIKGSSVNSHAPRILLISQYYT
ncbi:MAG: DUF4276 family protein [Nitrospinae bacterium]|nr:DUF4276 family protein [Nitrospinota bacterium]